MRPGLGKAGSDLVVRSDVFVPEEIVIGGKGSPSDHFMPLRRLKVKVLPSSATSQLLTTLGMISVHSRSSAPGSRTQVCGHERAIGGADGQQCQVAAVLADLFERLDHHAALPAGAGPRAGACRP